MLTSRRNRTALGVGMDTRAAHRNRLRTAVVRICLAGLASFAVISLGQTAKAENVDDLLACNRADHAVEREDGSLIVLGTSRNCGFDAYLASPNRWQALVGLNADGSVRDDFGQGGVVLGSLSEQEYVLDLVELEGGELIVLTDRRLRSYTPNGIPRQEFGVDGQIVPLSLDSLNSWPGSIVPTAGGGFLLGALHRDRGALVAAYDINGMINSDFGTDGVLETGIRANVALARDSSGRILVAGGGSLKRYSSAGDPDESFNEGSGVSAIPSWGIHDLSTMIDGRISVITGGWDGLYEHPAYSSVFDLGGSPMSEQLGELIDPSVQAAITYDEGVLFARTAGRHMGPTFTLGNAGQTGFHTYEFAPGTAAAFGFAALDDGSMLVLGKSEDSDCEAACGTEARMAMVKINPQTGERVDSFGFGGEQIIPGHSCARGHVGMIDAWKRCRVEKPAVSGSARIFIPGKGKPQAVLKATLGSPPPNLWGTVQRFDIALPRGMKLTRNAKRRIRVSTKPYTPFELTPRLRGLSVRLSPDYMPWPGWWEGVRGHDRQIEMTVRLKRGSLRKHVSGNLRKPVRFRVKGTFVPVRGGVAGSLAEIWFAPNSRTVGIRPSS